LAFINNIVSGDKESALDTTSSITDGITIND